MNTAFGTALKEWRTQRRMSQLDLGLSANVSARHISFLETGRSRPSRSMVLQLCEELEVPRVSRNHLLTAAGLAPAYANRNLSEDDMAPVRQAVDWMLERQDPFPAIAMDRHWTIVKLNRASTMLLAGMGVGIGDSMLMAVAANEQIKAALENYDEVLHHLICRVRTESAHLGGDPVLENALEKLRAARSNEVPETEGIMPAFIPARYRAGGAVFSFFSTFSQFGTAEDIALSELKIELMFPADEQTRSLLESL
ncbi:MAG: helix-turn-helix domain-containing protein [Pseudomonadota bacterium]